MNRFEFQKLLSQEKLVVVVRGKNSEDAIKIAKACISGGAKLIEITYTVKDASIAIEKLSKEFKGSDVKIGAGTVLEKSVAEQAFQSGAEYIVSPDFNIDLANYCNTIHLAYVPGVFTPTEISAALRANCLALKLFPGDVLNPKGLKALKGPFPNVDFMVTGGVNYDNLGEWFKAGALAVGAGSSLTAKAKVNDFSGVAEETKRWIKRISSIVLD